MSELKNNADKVIILNIFNEFRFWILLIKSNWSKLLITLLFFFTIGFLYAFYDSPIYVASTRFMLKNEGVGSLFGGQMSGLTSLLGGGQMGTPLERTAEIISSDKIVGKALLREMRIGDTVDIVINHFIRLSDLRKKWVNDSSLKNVLFYSKDDSLEKLNYGQRKAFKLVKNIMIPERENGVVRKSFDKKSGVLTLTCMHENEQFAIELSRILFNELNNFFIEQMTYSSTNNAEVMKFKLDSIQNQLNLTRKDLAITTDQSLGLLLQQDKVQIKKLSVKEQLLTVAYAEALKNYEAYQFMNQAAMPSLTLIDSPYSPIKPIKKNRYIYGTLVGLTSIFVLLFILRVRLYYSM